MIPLEVCIHGIILMDPPETEHLFSVWSRGRIARRALCIIIVTKNPLSNAWFDATRVLAPYRDALEREIHLMLLSLGDKKKKELALREPT